METAESGLFLYRTAEGEVEGDEIARGSSAARLTRKLRLLESEFQEGVTAKSLKISRSHGKTLGRPHR